MTDETPDVATPPAPLSHAERQRLEREERLAAALRANLRRRKDQKRQRKEDDKLGGEIAESDD